MTYEDLVELLKQKIGKVVVDKKYLILEINKNIYAVKLKEPFECLVVKEKANAE